MNILIEQASGIIPWGLFQTCQVPQSPLTNTAWYTLHHLYIQHVQWHKSSDTNIFITFLISNGCQKPPGMWPRSWRLGLEAISRCSSASARCRLGWNFKCVGLALASRLNVFVLASVSGFKVSVSPRSQLKRPRAHPCHFSITYTKLRLNVRLWFSLSFRLPPFLLGLHRSSEWCGCGMWPCSWPLGLEAVSRCSSALARARLGVGMSQPRLGLELWRPWSRSRLGLNCQRLGLGLGLRLQGLSLASVSTRKASCTSLKTTTYCSLLSAILVRKNNREHDASKTCLQQRCSGHHLIRWCNCSLLAFQNPE